MHVLTCALPAAPLLHGEIFRMGVFVQGTKLWTNKAPAVQADPEQCFALCLVLPESTARSLRLQQLEPPPTAGQAEQVGTAAAPDAQVVRDFGAIVAVPPLHSS